MQFNYLIIFPIVTIKIIKVYVFIIILKTNK